MKSWFGREPANEPPAHGGNLEAYKSGRSDERGAIQRDGATAGRAVSEGYDRGLREERLRHRGSPLLGLLTIVLLLLAVATIVLVVKTGSFSGAGAVLDNIVQPPLHAAADKTGAALEGAGQSIRNDPVPARP